MCWEVMLEGERIYLVAPPPDHLLAHTWDSTRELTESKICLVTELIQLINQLC